MSPHTKAKGTQIEFLKFCFKWKFLLSLPLAFGSLFTFTLLLTPGAKGLHYGNSEEYVLEAGRLFES